MDKSQREILEGGKRQILSFLFIYNIHQIRLQEFLGMCSIVYFLVLWFMSYYRYHNETFVKFR
jgi:hypothetical protein